MKFYFRASGLTNLKLRTSRNTLPVNSSTAIHLINGKQTCKKEKPKVQIAGLTGENIAHLLRKVPNCPNLAAIIPQQLMASALLKLIRHKLLHKIMKTKIAALIILCGLSTWAIAQTGGAGGMGGTGASHPGYATPGGPNPPGYATPGGNNRPGYATPGGPNPPGYATPATNNPPSFMPPGSNNVPVMPPQTPPGMVRPGGNNPPGSVPPGTNPMMPNGGNGPAGNNPPS